MKLPMWAQVVIVATVLVVTVGVAYIMWPRFKAWLDKTRGTSGTSSGTVTPTS